MKYFVNEDSIVRKIWGNADTILFIFAGASAEFALNKAVDWLYFTGRLPADPIGRLFSTVAYAKKIVFSEHDQALKAIDQITSIHKNVESQRGATIPDWAYRDVLFMLIDYSIRAFELLERKMTDAEKTEMFQVFNQVGLRMGISGLPNNFKEWQLARDYHLQNDLAFSKFTKDLYIQYKVHLGPVRYALLMQVQTSILPAAVKDLLPLSKIEILSPLLMVYKLFRLIGLDGFVKDVLLPSQYKGPISDMDLKPSLNSR